jgi:hypothetical protein
MLPVTLAAGASVCSAPFTSEYVNDVMAETLPPGNNNGVAKRSYVTRHV